MAQARQPGPPSSSPQGQVAGDDLWLLPRIENTVKGAHWPADKPFLTARWDEAYEKKEQIGEGTYGSVFAGYRRHDRLKVALKQLKFSRTDGAPQELQVTTLREIRHLQMLSCEKLRGGEGSTGEEKHVVKLIDVVRGGDTVSLDEDIYVVMEFMEHDLQGLAQRVRWDFKPTQVKSIMKQLLKGLHWCHSRGILHRDLKTANLLLNSEGILRIADFGLSRQAYPGDKTPRVVTLWYRSPELLMDARRYNEKIDIWSVGCIFAELLTKGVTLFPADNETAMLQKIFNLCGFPTEAVWPKVKEDVRQYQVYSNSYSHLKENRLRKFLEQQHNVKDKALSLVCKMLSLDPAKRPTALDCIKDDYFWEDPLPCKPHELPALQKSSHHWHMQHQQNQRNKRPAEAHGRPPHHGKRPHMRGQGGAGPGPSAGPGGGPGGYRAPGGLLAAHHGPGKATHHPPPQHPHPPSHHTRMPPPPAAVPGARSMHGAAAAGGRPRVGMAAGGNYGYYDADSLAWQGMPVPAMYPRAAYMYEDLPPTGAPSSTSAGQAGAGPGATAGPPPRRPPGSAAGAGAAGAAPPRPQPQPQPRPPGIGAPGAPPHGARPSWMNSRR